MVLSWSSSFFHKNQRRGREKKEPIIDSSFSSRVNLSGRFQFRFSLRSQSAPDSGLFQTGCVMRSVRSCSHRMRRAFIVMTQYPLTCTKIKAHPWLTCFAQVTKAQSHCPKPHSAAGPKTFGKSFVTGLTQFSVHLWQVQSRCIGAHERTQGENMDGDSCPVTPLDPLGMDPV